MELIGHQAASEIQQAVVEYCRTQISDKIQLLIAHQFEPSLRGHLKEFLTEMIVEAKREGAQEFAEKILSGLAQPAKEKARSDERVRGIIMQLKGYELTQDQGERIIQEVRIQMRKP